VIELCHGDFDDAVKQCGRALTMVERVGDLVLQSRCLTYRAVAYRRLADVGHCRTEAEKTLELATKLGMVEYIAMAKANLAWVAWRQEDHAEAEKLATEALDLWHRMDDPYGFDWMALWPRSRSPCIGKIAALQSGSRAVCWSKNQHPLPETLLNAIRKACDEWQNGAHENATAELISAMGLARELRYL